jgi:hypothetical protein
VAKYTYIVLIFIANILLSAHIIPHHHHWGAPHFVLFETHAGDKADDCCCDYGDEQTCLFEQDIDAVYEHADDNCFCASCILHQHPELFLQVAVYSGFIYDFSLIRETVTFPDTPYLLNYYCDYASAVWGLRAPPVSIPAGEFSTVIAKAIA